MACDSIPPVAFGSEGVPSLRPEVHRGNDRGRAVACTPVRAFPWAPPFVRAASTSACSRAGRPGSSYYSSTMPRRRSRRACIALDPRKHRTYHYWHVFVPGIGPGQLYAYRAFGPFDPEQGLRFDPSKALLDPYGRAVVVPEAYSRCRAADTESTTRSP